MDQTFTDLHHRAQLLTTKCSNYENRIQTLLQKHSIPGATSPQRPRAPLSPQITKFLDKSDLEFYIDTKLSSFYSKVNDDILNIKTEYIHSKRLTIPQKKILHNITMKSRVFDNPSIIKSQLTKKNKKPLKTNQKLPPGYFYKDQNRLYYETLGEGGLAKILDQQRVWQESQNKDKLDLNKELLGQTVVDNENFIGELKRWIREKQESLGRGKEGGLGVDGLTDTVEKLERGRRTKEGFGWECRGGERRFRSERMYFRHLLQDLGGGEMKDSLSEPTAGGDSEKEALEEMKSQKKEV